MSDNDLVTNLLARFEAFELRIMQQIEEMTVTINQTHVLVNSRMTRLIETMHQLAEAQEQVESDKAEKRGIAMGRKQASEPPKDG
jgi:hypothetical protein